MKLSTKRATLQFSKDTAKVKSIFENVRKNGRSNLLEEEGYEVLEAYGFPTPKSILCTTEQECMNAANQIGYPLVMKIVSPDIIHKSDAGGVKVGIKTDDELKNSFRTITENALKYKSDAKIKGVLVQEMVEVCQGNHTRSKPRSNIWTSHHVWPWWHLCRSAQRCCI